MKIIAALILLTALGLFGARHTFKPVSVAKRSRGLLLTGTEFLLAGVLLGPHAFGVLDAATLTGLTPFVNIGLGWIGLMFGLQFDLAKLKFLPKGYLITSNLASILSWLIMLPLVWPLIQSLMPAAPISQRLTAAVVLSLVAAGTAQHLVGLLGIEPAVRRLPIFKAIRGIVNLDDLSLILIFGGWVCVAHPSFQYTGPWGVFLWLLVSLLLSFLIALLLLTLTMGKTNESQRLLILVASLSLSGGLALQFHVSPLLINLLTGAQLATLSKNPERLAIVLGKGERTLYLALLMIIGAMAAPISPHLLLLTGGFIGIRLLAKAVAGATLGRRLLPQQSVRIAAAYSILPYGGIAVAILLSYGELYPGAMSAKVITIAVLCGLTLELASFFWLRGLIAGRRG